MNNRVYLLTYSISEIFYSIQGEGINAGLPCMKGNHDYESFILGVTEGHRCAAEIARKGRGE